MRTAFSLLLTALAAAVGRAQPAPTPPAAAPMPAAQPKAPEWPKEIGGKDLKGWLAELKDSPDGAMRETAAKVIPQFGPVARKEALTAFMNAVTRESDPGVRVNLLLVLGNIGYETPDEAKRIVDRLKVILNNASPGSPYKLHTARGLGHFGKYGADAIPELVIALEDTAWETRQAAAQTLGLVGRAHDKQTSPNRQALTGVSKRLKHEKSMPVRLELVQAMVVMGPPGVDNPNDAAAYAAAVEPYYKVIKDQLKDEKEKAIQVWLTVVVLLYDGSQLKEATVKKIADYVPGVDVGGRVAALRALALLNTHAKPFVPVITDALKNDDPGTVAEALNALAALGPLARPALPDLEKLKATTKDEMLKDLASQAIDHVTGKAGAAAQPAQPPKK